MDEEKGLSEFSNKSWMRKALGKLVTTNKRFFVSCLMDEAVSKIVK
jgi:hypothetical protein